MFKKSQVFSWRKTGRGEPPWIYGRENSLCLVSSVAQINFPHGRTSLSWPFLNLIVIGGNLKRLVIFIVNTQRTLVSDFSIEISKKNYYYTWDSYFLPIFIVTGIETLAFGLFCRGAMENKSLNVRISELCNLQNG